MLDVWPLPLEPWLPAAEKRAARLPARSAICPPLDNHNAAPLMLSGVREGAVIKRLPGEKNITLNVFNQRRGGATMVVFEWRTAGRASEELFTAIIFAW
ncbi:Penicillin-insensitive transglycosylase & transpeptidase PBP-1C [Enterobacter hormaechei]|nr:Penicillin-insensitive transglycosylase & transpeptidase PBP-1C [Enterobacter hormaechei]